MNDLWITRRGLLGATAATAFGLTACRGSGDPGPSDRDVPTAHVALTAPRETGQVLLASLTGPESVRPVAEAAAATGASVGFSSTVLPGLAPPLRTMPAFAGDVPDKARTARDLVVLVEADTRAECERRTAALRDRLDAHLTDVWSAPVEHPLSGESRGRPLITNVFGFVEGFGNPVDGAAHTLLGRADGPRWSWGGALLAMRVVQVSRELWDRDRPEEQQRIIGRRPDGTWLDGTARDEPAPYATDPDGATTPFDSHVRRANPRDGKSPVIELTRRGWTYRAPGEEGVLFLAYTNDLTAFETVQRRVTSDALAPYTLTVGGGYYFVPPPHLGWLRRLEEAESTA
ncbi:Dyp-type peroxidase [Nocardioides speluncae]|uniref:Dyp-type peroxidase n=1 Tax=Nocardioides speluncae TaxID=2670337 RepID=UPI000D69A854|nr:Dyp-type peroxidase [Nocardioides speluncae]